MKVNPNFGLNKSLLTSSTGDLSQKESIRKKPTAEFQPKYKNMTNYERKLKCDLGSLANESEMNFHKSLGIHSRVSATTRMKRSNSIVIRPRKKEQMETKKFSQDPKLRRCQSMESDIFFLKKEGELSRSVCLDKSPKKAEIKRKESVDFKKKKNIPSQFDKNKYVNDSLRIDQYTKIRDLSSNVLGTSVKNIKFDKVASPSIKKQIEYDKKRVTGQRNVQTGAELFTQKPKKGERSVSQTFVVKSGKPGSIDVESLNKAIRSTG